MAQAPDSTEEEQVYYLVMDENQQNQQIQFINGQPTLIMDPASAASSGMEGVGSDSQVLLVSEDGQLVTGNEGQVIVDEHGRVVMTTDEGHQVALETETVSVSEDGSGGQLQYVLPETSQPVSMPPTSHTTMAYVGAPGNKDDDGYTTIMIGGSPKVSQEGVGLKSVFMSSPVVSAADNIGTSSVAQQTTHPILSQQLGVLSQTGGLPHQYSPATKIMTAKSKESGTASPRSKPAMVSILDKSKLASATLGKVSEKPAVVAAIDVPNVSTCQQVAGDMPTSEALHQSQVLTYESLTLTAESPAMASIAEPLEPQVTHVEPMEVEEAHVQVEEEVPLSVEGAVSSEAVMEEGDVLDRDVVVGSPDLLSGTVPAVAHVEGSASDMPQEEGRLSDGHQDEECVAEVHQAEESVLEQPQIGGSVSEDVHLAHDYGQVTLCEEAASNHDESEVEPMLKQPVDEEDLQRESASFPAENGLPECVLSGDTDEGGMTDSRHDNDLHGDAGYLMGGDREEGVVTDSVVEENVVSSSTGIEEGQSAPTPGDIEVGFLPEESDMDLNSRAKEMVRDLEDYRNRRSEEKSGCGGDDMTIAVESQDDPDPLTESSGLMGNEGIMLGPFNYDSDDSTHENTSLVEPEIRVATSVDEPDSLTSAHTKHDFTSIKATTKVVTTIKELKEISSGNESDNTSRRRSSRYKSPKRYSEEPIIFGDDWGVKPTPKPHSAPANDSPRKKGRPPKKRPYYTWEEIESSDNDSADACDKQKSSTSDEEKVAAARIEPLKKRVSREIQERKSASEDDSQPFTGESQLDAGKPTRQAPKKRFLEQHNNKQDDRTEDVDETKESSDEDFIFSASDELSSFSGSVSPSRYTSGGVGPGRGIPKRSPVDDKEEMIKAAMEAASPRVRKTPRKSEPVTDSFGFDDEDDKEMEEVIDEEVAEDGSPSVMPTITVTAPVEETNQEADMTNETASPSSAVAGKTSPDKGAHMKKPNSDSPHSAGPRKYGINFKSMKFSVSKRSPGTSVESSGKIRRIFTSGSKGPAGPTLHKEHYQALEKDLKNREAILLRREQKLRALDVELDTRASQLRAKEGRMDRLQRQLKELERSLELRERLLKTSEHQQMAELAKRKKFEKRKSSKISSETSSVASTSPTTKHREGLFEKLANLSKVPERSLLEQLQDESSSMMSKPAETEVSVVVSMEMDAEAQQETPQDADTSEPPSKKVRHDDTDPRADGKAVTMTSESDSSGQDMVSGSMVQEETVFNTKPSRIHADRSSRSRSLSYGENSLMTQPPQTDPSLKPDQPLSPLEDASASTHDNSLESGSKTSLEPCAKSEESIDITVELTHTSDEPAGKSDSLQDKLPDPDKDEKEKANDDRRRTRTSECSFIDAPLTKIDIKSNRANSSKKEHTGSKKSLSHKPSVILSTAHLTVKSPKPVPNISSSKTKSVARASSKSSHARPARTIPSSNKSISSKKTPKADSSSSKKTGFKKDLRKVTPSGKKARPNKSQDTVSAIASLAIKPSKTKQITRASLVEVASSKTKVIKKK